MTTGPPLIVVANRLPVSHGAHGWQISTGGLVTALRPVAERRAGAWVGWDGGSPDVPRHVEGLVVELVPVELSRADVHSYYHGFSNRTIWPLFHDLLEPPRFDRAWWRQYVDVNERFARAVARVRVGKDPLLWVHDYHLMLVPEFLRRMQERARIAFFLHIPWPPPELFARLPWREEILRGLLSADVVSFHTDRYRKNFVRTCGRVLSDVRVRGGRLLMEDGREVRTSAHPISIDVDEFAGLASGEETQRIYERLASQFEGRRVLLGVDRLDYTKGIVERLEAFEGLLERRADLRRKVALVQIAVPSRGAVSEYRDLRIQIEQLVGRINGKFTEPGGDVPVHYIHRSVPRPRLVAYYLLADVMMVTPLKDGMNLVAKEYVVSEHAGRRTGTLLLSEFTGAALELTEAITCNPFDVEGLSHKIEEALELDVEERERRLVAMTRRIRRNDVHRWMEHVLADIAPQP